MKVRSMRPMAWLALALCLTVPLVACQETYKNGSDIQSLQDLKIEKGKTTEQELVSRLGPPMSRMERSDGTTMLTWSGGKGTASGTGTWGSALLSVVPGGILLAHDDMKMQSESLQVTVKDGVVIDYAVISTNQNMPLFSS